MRGAVSRARRTRTNSRVVVQCKQWKIGKINSSLLLIRRYPRGGLYTYNMAAKYRVLLPKTKFPLRVNPSNQEPSIQKAAGFNHLYKWQLNRPNTEGNFILHDGPPYANGKPHMGHVLNKVLKDVINRYKLMRGYKVHYRPGWDCHGLPIELKACKESDFLEASPQKIRKKAAEFARKTIKIQKEAFQRWGCMGDWESPYLTMDPVYEADQVRVFYQMYQKGCIYRGFRPVYWSPSSGTALAEAELEYRDHTSRAVYVLFPIVPGSMSSSLPQISDSLNDDGGGIFALVWTTTPWTLAANKAICFHPEHTYSLIQIGGGSEKKRVLVGAECLPRLEPILGEYSVLDTLSGTALEGLKYQNPLETQVPVDAALHRPFLPGDHVTETEGSGLVHTAPAHGFEDHSIGVRYSLELDCIVNDKGKYTNEAGPTLDNLFILREGNETIISELRAKGTLLHESSYTHRYPYDWRTKKPVIIRSTEQWFASVAALKEKAMSALNDVRMYPSSSLNRLIAFLETRNDWCISRQRVWGVPLPIFYDCETGEPLISDETIGHIEDTFRQHGSDSWWNTPISDLLPSSLRYKAQKYIKETDIMDVWFDSGSSWASVLKDSDCVADLYLEGSDQHRGWFQSSLLTSVAAQGRPPYRKVMTHGFVLDSKANKMSKSLGNVISPDDVLKSEKQFGADTMRLWAAFSNYSGDVHISDEILQQTNDFLQKIRITCRFALGNLSSFDPVANLLPYSQLSSLDRYMLHILSCYTSEATQAYESFNFSRLQTLLNKLIPNDLSAFYFEIIKDRLYCDALLSRARCSTQTALYHVLHCLTRSIAPILPHLAEEVAQHSSTFIDGSVFKSGWMECPTEWYQPSLAREFQLLRSVKDVSNKVLETARLDGAIRSSLEAELTLKTNSEHLTCLLSEHLHKSDTTTAESTSDDSVKFSLADLLIVSKVTLNEEVCDREGYSVSEEVDCGGEMVGVQALVRQALRSGKHKCPRCWKWTNLSEGVLCSRCQLVVNLQ